MITGSYSFYGVTVDPAYAKITAVSVAGETMTFTVWVYTSPSVTQPFDNPILSAPYDLQSGVNVYDQAYAATKSDPRFENWTDC